MKYFVLSDIHGFFHVMRKSLDKSGYDANNPTHHLIVVGDMFDRGPESKEVLEYLYPLYTSKRASIVLGNHDYFLQEFLEKDYERARFNIQYNGFAQTLESLAEVDISSPDELDEIHGIIVKKYPYLYDFLISLPYFVELDNYIFVHGGIDPKKGDYHELDRHDYIWSREHLCDPIPGKIVVSGHTRIPTITHAGTSYKNLFLTNKKAFDILYLDGKILIDRFVEVSQELNVLTIEI